MIARISKPTITACIVLSLLMLSSGCGGGTPPDGKTKERISTATLNIAIQCIGGDADQGFVKENVDTLLDEADKAGDATFDLGKFKNTTMDAQLKYRADEMRRDRCAPSEERRLREAAK